MISPEILQLNYDSYFPEQLLFSIGYNEALTHLPLDKMAATLADDISKGFFFNKHDSILIQISLKFVPRSSTDNNPLLVLVMAWRRTGDKPLPEPMMTQFIDAYMRH